MSVIKYFTAAISLGLVGAQAANACTFAPPPPLIVGESAEAFQKRKAKVDEEYRKRIQESIKAGQAHSFDEARSVFFGRIVKSEEIETDGAKFGRRAEVEPLAAIKGPLPKNRTALSTVALTSCGFEGTGRALWSEVGSLAIIFDGVQPDGPDDLPVDSMLPNDARDERIVAAVNEFVAKHPEYRTEPE